MKKKKYELILHELKEIDKLARSSVSNEEPIDLIAVTQRLDRVTDLILEEVE